MNWRRLLSTLLLYSVFLFVFIWLSHQRHPDLHFTSHDYFVDALWAISMSMGYVGSDELRRSGNRRITLVLFGCALICLVIWSVTIFVFKQIHEAVLLLYLPLLLIAAQFPVAIYLIYRPGQSNPQSTDAHAD